MNSTPVTHNGSTKLAEHFSRLEEILADLKHKIDVGARAQQHAPMPPVKAQPRHLPDPTERADRAREMLAQRGSITAADVQLEMGVGHSTAMRTLQAIARAKGGTMVLEVAGPTFRVRLWHPDRVILDHVPR